MAAVQPPLRPAVFLDRDGVINRTFVRDGVSVPPATLDAFEFLPGVREAAFELHAAGFALVVVTNQPDVARGSQSQELVEAMNQIVRDHLPVLDVYACYHDTGDGCSCRKPLPGMLLAAAGRWQLDLGASYMVGDRWSDIIAGQAAGCRTLLVQTPHSGASRCNPDHTVRDLAEAAARVLSLSPRRGVA